MARRGAGAGGAYLLRALNETKERVGRGSCLFDRVAQMKYSIERRDDVSEGKVVVSLNPEDKQSIDDEDALNRQLLSHLNSLNKKEKSKIDPLVNKATGVSIFGAAVEFVLQTAGLGASSMKDPLRTAEKVIARALWDDERKVDQLNAQIRDGVTECANIAQRVSTKL